MKGVNSRLDPIQAAVLRAKLPHLDEWTDRRREIASQYTASLADIDVALPRVPEWADPVWHLYVIRSTDRQAVRQRLADKGINTLIHYPVPPHLQQAYSRSLPAGLELPIATRLATEILSLPIGPQLPRADVDRVACAVRNAAA